MCLSILESLLKQKSRDNNMEPVEPEHITENDCQENSANPEHDDLDVNTCSTSYYYSNKDYSNFLVILDNGHGIDTPGKGSPYALNKITPELYLKEYQWNREIAQRLSYELNILGIETYNVCPEEKDISLTNRYKRANAKKNSSNKRSVFISIHVNAAGNGTKWTTGRGWSAYTTKGNNNSDKLAECLYDAAEEILPELGIKIRTDVSDGDRDYEENFTVIYGANMPAVLTENLFQDNIEDTRFLLSEEGKSAIVELHKRGILKYIERYC